MKKWFSIVLATVCVISACLSFASCNLFSMLKPKELQLDKEYVYKSVSFKKADDITFEDIGAFVPIFPAVIGAHPTIQTIEEFEKYLKDNLDDYTIDKHTEDGVKRFSLKPVKSVRITEGFPYIAHAFSLWIKTEVEGEVQELRYGAICDGNKFIPSSHDLGVESYYFEDRALHCDFELNDKFAVVYNFELQ